MEVSTQSNISAVTPIPRARLEKQAGQDLHPLLPVTAKKLSFDLILDRQAAFRARELLFSTVGVAVVWFHMGL